MSGVADFAVELSDATTKHHAFSCAEPRVPMDPRPVLQRYGTGRDQGLQAVRTSVNGTAPPAVHVSPPGRSCVPPFS